MENAITLCQGCHLYFTLRPAEWAEWCEEWWFSESGIRPRDPARANTRDHGWGYYGLRHRALNDPPEKAADALARLKEIL
jgi:hypothetical protein